MTQYKVAVRRFLMIAAILLWAISARMGFGLVSQRQPQLPPELSYEEFLAEIRQGHVHEVPIWDKQVSPE